MLRQAPVACDVEFLHARFVGDPNQDGIHHDLDKEDPVENTWWTIGSTATASSTATVAHSATLP